MIVNSAKKRRQQRKTVAAVIFMAIGITIVSSMIWLRMSATSTKLDADTLCPEDGANAFTVLLIDGTDSFSPIQRADIERNLQAFANSIDVGERLTVFAPTEMTEAVFLQPVFEKCNPGTDAEVSGFTQNPKQIQLRYEKGFRDQLIETLRSGLSTTEKSTSPIMAMIQAAAITGYPVGAGFPKRLVIVSDMLENTADYSQYTQSLDFETVKKRPFFAHLSVNLDGAEVEILYVTRAGAEVLQTRRHILYWEEYFRFLNGDLVQVTKVGG